MAHMTRHEQKANKPFKSKSEEKRFLHQQRRRPEEVAAYIERLNEDYDDAGIAESNEE